MRSSGGERLVSQASRGHAHNECPSPSPITYPQPVARRERRRNVLHIPAADQFPGTGEKGNGIPPFLKTQGAWIDTVKNSCQSCHALGSENIRAPRVKELGDFANSTDMWARRIQSGQAMTNMAVTLMRLGPEKGLSLFADWTDRIAKGELPSSKPS